MTTVILLTACFSILAVYKLILYPLFLSPLAPIPAIHPLAKITPLYALWMRLTYQENTTLLAAHRRLGDVVQVGPKDIAVNCIDGGVKTVYGKGFDKPSFYSVFDEFQFTCLFSSLESRPHAVKKKRISHIYSKSHLNSSPTVAGLTRELARKHLLPLYRRYAESGASFDAVSLCRGLCLDYPTAYFFGLKNGTKYITNKKAREDFRHQFELSRPPDRMIWRHELPQVTRMLQSIGIYPIPKTHQSAWEVIDRWALGMADAAERTLADPESTAAAPEDYPYVYHHLMSATAKESFDSSPSVRVNSLGVTSTHDNGSVTEKWRHRSPQQLEVVAELLDDLIASTDAMSTGIVYALWELSRYPECQKRLREEARVLWGDKDDIEDPVPNAADADALPYLQAVIKETLRLHPPVAGSQPRLTPPSQTCTIGRFANIPGGTRVQASAWSLHRNPDMFPEPESWHPERWLRTDEGETKNQSQDQQQDKKDRWFWAFGSGSRMCVGSNLAILIMKHVITATYANFETYIVNDDGIEQADGFVAPPKGDKLFLGIRALT